MLSLLFSFFISTASAAPTVCPDVGGVVSEVIFLKHEDCALAQEASEIFNRMAVAFHTAPSVTLVIGGPEDNAGFDNGHIVQIPYRMVFQGEYGQEHPILRTHLITSAAHEYGHAIFTEYLKQSFPEIFGDVLQKFSELSLRKVQILKGHVDAEYSKDMEAVTGSKDYQLMYTFTTAYNEFYADLLAVFIRYDKSAMFAALYYEGMSDFQYNYVRMRDFASMPGGRRWDYILSEDHAKLAYCRGYVGQYLWPEEGQIFERSDQILRAVMFALGHKLETGDTPDFESANKELIAELAKIKNSQIQK